MRSRLTVSQQAELAKIGHFDFAGLLALLAQSDEQVLSIPVRPSQVDCQHKMLNGRCSKCDFLEAQAIDAARLYGRLGLEGAR